MRLLNLVIAIKAELVVKLKNYQNTFVVLGAALVAVKVLGDVEKNNTQTFGIKIYFK